LQKRPVVSGEKLLKVLVRLGYEIIRQRGSHVRLIKHTPSGDHNGTVSEKLVMRELKYHRNIITLTLTQTSALAQKDGISSWKSSMR